MSRFRIQHALCTLVLTAAAAAPAAHAGTITYGSDLKADATIIEAHQGDAAFWPTSIRGNDPGAPEEGQITAIRLKGTVVQEPGAHTPLNEVHFQHLVEHPDGSVTESQTTAAMDVPYTGDPNQITTYQPENLCVGKGDIVDFNDEGGWAYNGSGGSLDYNHYRNGAPFRVFGAVGTSTTAWFSKDSATFGGMSWAPAAPFGGVKQGQELLMQLVLATGDDIGVPCRNFLGMPPVQHESAPTQPAPRLMKIRPQASHVSSARAVGPMIYCPGKGPACTGTGQLTYKGRVIAKGTLSGAGPKTLRIPMKISPALYKQLRKARHHTLSVTFAVVSSLGTYSRVIQIRS